MHDVYIETFRGERAKQCAPGHDPCEVVFGWTGQDFRIIDFTNKKAPQVISTLTYDSLGFPHSGWITKNKQWLFNFDEFDELDTGMNTRILSINIKDFRRPQVKARWDGSTSAIEHNGYVVGTKLYISSYTRGLEILDVKNPTQPKEIAFFDTFPEHDRAALPGLGHLPILTVATFSLAISTRASLF
jgi:choice-of-anchor B domain-containing protein